MVFSSLYFLFIFLPIVLVGYILLPISLRNFWLLVSSLLFYYIGAPDYMWLLLMVIGMSYIAGILVSTEKIVGLKPTFRKVVLVVYISAVLGVLSYFKYADFLIGNINAIFHIDNSPIGLVLPIGISFFIFQAISYVVDVWRGEMPLKNPIDMALYISLFPQLIAGPIVRFHDVHKYLAREYRHTNFNNITYGIWRFSIGLSKKVILANNLGGLVDIVFSMRNLSRFSVCYTWLGAIAYTLQIYYDFSGYSDMAIGLGKMFGFEFQENFNYPYSAISIKDFWRRWHISLSQFFRDYVYIPLGGNRCAPKKWIRNMMVVWMLTGLWHGASWTFVMWGIIYGVLLILESYLSKFKVWKKCINQIGHIYTMVVVTVLWVLFKAGDSDTAKQVLQNMFGIGTSSFIDDAFLFQISNYWRLIVISFILSVPVIPKIKSILSRNRIGIVIYEITTFIGLGIAVLASVSYLYMGSYNPFLYFRF